MKFEVYCDESRPELFSSKIKAPPYLSIGSIWIPAGERETIKNEIKELKQQHHILGEFKWNRVTKKSLPLDKAILDYFFSNQNIRFRTILVDSRHVDLVQFHESDAELGFYKFYYQLIHHWVLDFNEYFVFVDKKTNRLPDRLTVLQRVLNHSNLSSKVVSIQALPAREVVLIQLVDLLTGMVNAKLNQTITSESKISLIKHVEETLGREIAQTSKSEEKFNVFKIMLQGGW